MHGRQNSGLTNCLLLQGEEAQRAGARHLLSPEEQLALEMHEMRNEMVKSIDHLVCRSPRTAFGAGASRMTTYPQDVLA